ncbi:MAG: hypothetical protein FWE53_05055 [Firmicutes bacterium]|nr:hypothetical protein [Bacillota bacterium]
MFNLRDLAPDVLAKLNPRLVNDYKKQYESGYVDPRFEDIFIEHYNNMLNKLYPELEAAPEPEPEPAPAPAAPVFVPRPRPQPQPEPVVVAPAMKPVIASTPIPDSNEAIPRVEVPTYTPPASGHPAAEPSMSAGLAGRAHESAHSPSRGEDLEGNLGGQSQTYEYVPTNPTPPVPGAYQTGQQEYNSFKEAAPIFEKSEQSGLEVFSGTDGHTTRQEYLDQGIASSEEVSGASRNDNIQQPEPSYTSKYTGFGSNPTPAAAPPVQYESYDYRQQESFTRQELDDAVSNMFEQYRLFMSDQVPREAYDAAVAKYEFINNKMEGGGRVFNHRNAASPQPQADNGPVDYIAKDFTFEEREQMGIVPEEKVTEEMVEEVKQRWAEAKELRKRNKMNEREFTAIEADCEKKLTEYTQKLLMEGRNPGKLKHYDEPKYRGDY